MSRHPRSQRPIDAAFALPFGFFGLLIIGALTVAGDGRLNATGVLVLTGMLVAGVTFFADPLAAPPMVVIGWFTVAAFSRPPYGDLHPSGTGLPALVLGVVAVGAAGIATLTRRVRSARAAYRSIPRDAGVTLDDVTIGPISDAASAGLTSPIRPFAAPPRAAGLSRRRVAVGLVAAIIGLPALSVILAAERDHLPLIDDALLYLCAVIALTLIGGFWTAVSAAVAAALLLNWFFTPPLHTWTVDAPQNILALLLFVTSAVTVSSVVHLAARRSALAANRAAEADTLLALAHTVLSGQDSPQQILDHLNDSVGLSAELEECSAGRWIRVAGRADHTDSQHVVAAGTDRRLVVFGDVRRIGRRLLEGFAAQAAAAAERQRLRIQASQTEALAAGNRMRTALLAAVSHDLRTPLASVKAGVSSLRQTDITLTPEDEAALLATIEDGADRLDALIGNLLDMSRLYTGALQPFIRPTALDEVAPLLVAGLEGGERIRFEIPDALPLINTDPGLLERALANLAANALRYSPPDQPPTISATASERLITVYVTDHGPGIAVARRQDAFEPFQQLGDQRTGSGVGLGLAVAKGFIEAVGGTIEATSTSGGGLTMRIGLPAAGGVVAASLPRP